MASVPGASKADNDALGEELVDEFTFPGNQQELLQDSQARVQTLFPVAFTVLFSVENVYYDRKEERKVPERIWVQLKGKREAVQKAKEFIKGISDPELATTEAYPKEMHCIFIGAHSAFLRSLIRDTCANIAVLEIGILTIRGGTEPVVMAQSKVQQFVQIFRDNVCLTPCKEPEVKRRFKDFVEAHADKYTMDLLLLPSALKEELLILMADDHYLVPHDDTALQVNAVSSCSKDKYPCRQDEVRTTTPVTELMCQMDSLFPGVPQSNLPSSPAQQERLKGKRRGSEKENECRKKTYSLEDIHADNEVITISDTSANFITADSDDPDIIVLDQEPVTTATEYKMLVNFFKTMGYPQDLVEKVIGDLGQSEEPLKLMEELELRSKKSNLLPSQEVKSSPNTQNHGVNKTGSKEVVTVEPDVHLQKPTEMSTESRVKRLEAERTLSKNVGFVARGTASPPRNKQMLPSDAPGPSNYIPLQIAKEIPVKSYNMSQAAKTLKNESRPGPPVTGVQIFLNSIKTPYKLELKYEPGREDVKHIIIDGSNIAMSHGLQRFYSCRGIAIAVQYFWKRGHRKITVFVPQWRTKRDPNITEQHFLQQLEELGILSFTPARTVMGSRIASHDDRFLLHLAEKTEGIIVTNDNLREFVEESSAWREIIKERILQFTFVGDIFMLPDDPLGRYGPKLNDFLTTTPNKRYTCQNTLPDSGVFFPSHDPPSIRGPAIFNHPPPYIFPPKQINPAIVNMPRPRAHHPPQRSFEETVSLKAELARIFPEKEQREKINQVLSAHPYMRDLNALSAMILD